MSESIKNSPPPDPNQHFRTDHLKTDLKSRSVRGGAVTMITQGCKFVLNMGSTVLLARLLTPQDYGLVGMVATVTGLVGLFKDMGLSTATVQKAEINHAQISTLFWLNVVFSIATMLITAVIAPLIAWFYGEPRLIWITLVSAIGFIFGGLTVQHQALLNRQMRFGALAIIDIVSMLIGVATAIVLALNGAGYWALVLMPLAMGMSSALGVWVMCGWRPGLPVRHSGVSSMLAFGANLTGFGIINYFARNLDNLLIGRYWGAQQLGLYSKAYALLLLPINQINAPIASVALPTLSRLVDSPDRYRQAYLRIVEKLLMLTMPIMVFMIATSDWLVQLLLGSQWGETSRIFALLGIAGLIQPLANSTGWLFMSQDRAHDMFKWGFIGGTTAIVSFVAGLPWGAAGVAASYSLVWICVCMPLLFWFVGRTGPVRTIDFYRVLAPFVCTTLGTLLVLLGFRKYVEVSNPLIGCAIAFGITIITFLLILTTMPAGRLALQDIKNMVVKSKP
ncbi:lipopolysaccharide biosynthesis protein [Funiculus sociatus GB2-A5]|uniref:Lipopolysaccharide biosynthesis protein n=1 Tax=Funiculus sociatus GB2-A5 TaxID=2933946 RepID=A0ABV0JKC2_9CYAN|nr:MULTISPECIES: lipopolysaccharide biosynthesis protein [unclassified Trichocoleus]